MPHMTSVDGQLFSIESRFNVQVTANADGGELWVADVAFDEPMQGHQFRPVKTFGPNESADVSVPTPDLGHLYRLRLFGGLGSPSGDGHIIDEFNIPRLKSGQRQQYLSMCTGEGGPPQLGLETGGTFVKALIGSGKVVTRALLLISDAQLDWLGSELPKLSAATPNNFVLSSASDSTGLIADLTVEDLRADGWPDSKRLGPGQEIRFVALAWDDVGAFDFTWTSEKAMPTDGTTPPPPEVLTTKQRRIALAVTELVCLDDSDDLSDGEAVFSITATPQPPATPDVRSVSWKPMETGSTITLSERFDLVGAPAESLSISIDGREKDSGSFPHDDDDYARASARLQFRRGPGTETFDQSLTLESNVGGDDFHFQMNCSVAVSYE